MAEKRTIKIFSCLNSWKLHFKATPPRKDGVQGCINSGFSAPASDRALYIC